MRLKKLIKEFTFDESSRKTLVFTSPEIRLVPERRRLELNGFPIGSDFQIRTRLSNPANAKGWISFQADSDAPAGTSIGYRLSSDGSNDFWWDGVSWTLASPGEWNTEAEIAANIATFPIFPDQAIQVVVNLETTDAARTPWVSRLKILYDSDVNFQEDYIIRSLRRHMYDTLRGISVFATQGASEMSNVDLDQVEQPYDITDAIAAYDITADPKRLLNLADVYTPATKVLTFTTPIPAGDVVEVHFEYRPKVSVAAGQDFVELNKVPAVVIENIVVSNTFEITKGESVVDKTTFQAWELEDAYHANIEFDLRCLTGSERDQQLLSDELKAYFLTNDFLRSVGQDELYRLDLLSNYSQLQTANQPGLHSGRLRAAIIGAVFYELGASDKTGVRRLATTGGNLNLDTSL